MRKRDTRKRDTPKFNIKNNAIKPSPNLLTLRFMTSHDVKCLNKRLHYCKGPKQDEIRFNNSSTRHLLIPWDFDVRSNATTATTADVVFNSRRRHNILRFLWPRTRLPSHSSKVHVQRFYQSPTPHHLLWNAGPPITFNFNRRDQPIRTKELSSSFPRPQ